MHSVKRAGEHEIVVAGEFGEARVELAVVDKTTRLADYEESKHDHFGSRYGMKRVWRMGVLKLRRVLNSSG